MWKRIKAAKWGEIALWTGFVVFGLVGSSAGMEAITLSGLCALAAVGVRATRNDAARSD